MGLNCVMSRPYDPDLRDCNQPECADNGPAQDAFELLESQCHDDPSGCCSTAEQQAAFSVLWEYHELCTHEDMTMEQEHGLHEFESACAVYSACNAPESTEPGYDPTVCVPPPAFEWAGVFAVDDSSHTWSMQAVDGEYADATMRLVLFPTDAPTAETMESLEDQASSLMEGESCAVIEDGESMSGITAEGSCFELHVGTGDDSTFAIDTSGITGLA